MADSRTESFRRAKSAANERRAPRSAFRGFVMPRQLEARVLGVSQKTVTELRQGKTRSETTKRRLAEIERLLAALSELMDRESIADWLITPNEEFENLKPVEVIERGQVDRIWQMIYALRSGEPD